MSPVFEIFDPIGSLIIFYASARSDLPPLSAEKIGLSLSHLVAEICGPKIGLISDPSFFQTRRFDWLKGLIVFLTRMLTLLAISVAKVLPRIELLPGSFLPLALT